MTNEPSAPAPINDVAAEHLVESYGAGNATGTPNLPSLNDAIEHLRQFRYTFNEGEAVDEESRLSADDLTVIINAIDAAYADVIARMPGDGPTA